LKNRNNLYHFPTIEATSPDLSTAQLAARTGLTAGTLRMWERRHAFPAPARLPGRHRRYSERDVELVREVLRLRDQGLSLAAAIERARRAFEPPPASVFAGLRRRHPEIQPVSLDKRALLGLTRAIEDEYCARGSGGLLIASFQRERFYRQGERRWREVARGAELAVALADFETLAEPDGGPVEVPLNPAQPMAREWTLVIEAPEARACLAAWEKAAPRELPDARREFEVLWSFEPRVVRSSADVAVALLEGLAPQIARRVPRSHTEPADAATPELRFATSLANRVVGYLSSVR
jgi:DICT domain-containing protein